MNDLVERLREESMRLSGRSLDRACVDSGIAANLADQAADEIERLREALASVGKVIPTNWLDPLLSGPAAVGKLPFDQQAVERLLLGIVKRLPSIKTGNRSEP